MGMLIAVKAPPEDILRDVQISLTLSRQRGGVWAAEAEALLADVLRRGTAAGRALVQADIDLSAARYQLTQASKATRLVTGTFYDELRNTLGRVRYDQQLDALFPGGISQWQSGSTESLILKLDPLASQLAAVDHPLLSSARCAAMAVEVLALAATLKTAWAAVTRTKAHRSEASRLYQALGRAAHIQLSLFKKILLGRRYRQDQIHEVIPDRTQVRVVPKADEGDVTAEDGQPESETEADPQTESPPASAEQELPPEPEAEPAPEPASEPRKPLSVVPAAEETSVTTTTVTTTTKAA